MNVIRQNRFASCFLRVASVLVLGAALTVSGEALASSPSATPVTGPASRAMLLLHEPGQTPFVWNEWVRQGFDNRCPIIRYGVMFGEEGYQPGNGVYCYRIEWLSAHHPVTVADSLDELESAWGAIAQRHSQTDLIILAQGKAGSVARDWLDQRSPATHPVRGLLVIGGHSERAVTRQTRTFRSPRFDLMLEANSGNGVSRDPADADSAHTYGYAQMDFRMSGDHPASANILERGADINRVLAFWLGSWWGQP